MDNQYILIQWPDSQEYMEYDWFEDEAILDVDSKTGDSSYLIPESRYIEILTNSIDTNKEKGNTLKTLLNPDAEDDSITPLHQYIIDKVEDLAKQYPTTKEDEQSIDKEWEDEDGYGPFMGGMSTSEAIINIKLDVLNR